MNIRKRTRVKYKAKKIAKLTIQWAEQFARHHKPMTDGAEELSSGDRVAKNAA